MSLKLLGKKIFLPLIFVGVGGGAVAMTDKSFDELVGKIGFDVNNKVQVKKIFDQIDTDKSGRISRECGMVLVERLSNRYRIPWGSSFFKAISRPQQKQPGNWGGRGKTRKHLHTSFFLQKNTFAGAQSY